MRIKSITIYKPDGNTTFYGEGGELTMAGKVIEPRVTVKKLEYSPIFKEVNISLSDGQSIVYHKMAVSYDPGESIFGKIKEFFKNKKQEEK